MNYRSSIDYLFGLQRFGIKLGLRNITLLLRHLGNPHLKLNCIHVAGSNGKGSTCALLHSILLAAGYRTAGLYTSPHLIDFTERMHIGRRQISRSRVAGLTAVLKKTAERKGLRQITFFEFVTAMALLYFAEEKADPVIIETGLGGTHDATNVIMPLITVITTISLEHQQYLGKTLASIAREKAGIIKPGVPLVSGARKASVNGYLQRRCRFLKAPFYALGKDILTKKTKKETFSYTGISLHLKDLRCGLLGGHQIGNAALAAAAAELLSESGYSAQPQHISRGLAQARWPGRMEVLQQRPTVLIDGAHNPEGWRVLRKSLRDHFSGKRLFLILGVMQDKNISALLKILTPCAYAIIVCMPDMHRAASRAVFENFIRFSDADRVFWRENPRKALRSALAQAAPDDLICAAGSLFLAGEIRQMYQNKPIPASGRIGL